jgi:dihydroorotate dehydrogenase electron transfer subunit
MIDKIATVESNAELAPGYRLLVLSFDDEVRARAGQFAMLRAQASYEPLLRRALAVYRVYGARQIGFLYQVLGRGTEALSHLVRGGKVDALVPLGNSWPLDDRQSAPAPETKIEEGYADSAKGRRAIVVAGGIGSASVLMLSEDLARAGREAQIFFGAANAGAATGCGLEDFRALGLPLAIATVDGSLGERAPEQRLV